VTKFGRVMFGSLLRLMTRRRNSTSFDTIYALGNVFVCGINQKHLIVNFSCNFNNVHSYTTTYRNVFTKILG